MSKPTQNWEALERLENSLYDVFSSARERGVDLPAGITEYLTFLESLPQRSKERVP